MTRVVLARYARQINEAHLACLEAEQTAKQQALRAGTLLLEVKAHVRHGQFIPWVRAHCRFSERTAQEYMLVTKFCAANPQRVAHLTSLRALLAAVRVPEDGPPYAVSLHRPVLRFECADSAEYGRVWDLLGILKARGNPVPTLIEALAALTPRKEA